MFSWLETEHTVIVCQKCAQLFCIRFRYSLLRGVTHHSSFQKPGTLWHSSNHWSNEDPMLRYVEKVIVPFITKKQVELNLACDHPTHAIFDVFRCQTEQFLAALKEQHIQVVFVPANCTDLLQPLDLSVNKPFKDHIRSKFVDWYAAEVRKQLDNGVLLQNIKSQHIYV